MRINLLLSLLVLLILGVYALALLFAPLYFYLTDWEHFQTDMVWYLVVYIVSAIIYNCTPLAALITSYQIYLDTMVHAPLCTNMRKEETNEEAIDTSATTNTCTTSTSR